jgi:hypothetical protein
MRHDAFHLKAWEEGGVHAHVFTSLKLFVNISKIINVSLRIISVDKIRN